MNRLYKYLLISILAIFLSACGGDGSSAVFYGNNTDSTKIVFCSTTTNIQEYTLLKDNDIIVKETEETVISIYHNSNGEKLVCVESGSAFVQEAL